MTIKTLWSDTAFTDVTLACDDDKQILAHKVILGSSSSFFRKILYSNPHKHPLIYLKGIGYSELKSLIRFMYLGQTEVEHDDLQKFMNAAKELKVRGLHDNLETDFTDEKKIQPKIVNRYSEIQKQNIIDENQFVLINIEEAPEEDVTDNFSIKEEKSIKKYSCGQCEYQTNFPHDLRRHKSVIHEGYKPFACDMCDYRAIQTSDLKKHKMRRHLSIVQPFNLV